MLVGAELTKIRKTELANAELTMSFKNERGAKITKRGGNNGIMIESLISDPKKRGKNSGTFFSLASSALASSVLVSSASAPVGKC